MNKDKVKLDKFHYHEFLHTISIILDMTEDHLMNHHVGPNYTDQIQEIQQKLCELSSSVCKDSDEIFNASVPDVSSLKGETVVFKRDWPVHEINEGQKGICHSDNRRGSVEITVGGRSIIVNRDAVELCVE